MMNSGESGIRGKIQVGMGCIFEVELTAFAIELDAESEEMVRTKDDM